MSLSIARVFSLARTTNSPADRRALVNACEEGVTLADLPAMGSGPQFSRDCAAARRIHDRRNAACPPPLTDVQCDLLASPKDQHLHTLYYCRAAGSELSCYALRAHFPETLGGFTLLRGDGAERGTSGERTNVVTIVAPNDELTRELIRKLCEDLKAAHRQERILWTTIPLADHQMV